MSTTQRTITKSGSTISRSRLIKGNTSSNPKLKLTGSLRKKVSSLKLTSAKIAATEIKALKLSMDHIAPILQDQFKASERKAINFSKGLMSNWEEDDQAIGESAQLIGWAKQGAKQRRMMVKAFNQNKQGLHLVHNISLLSQKDARSFMKDYFAEGGTEHEIAEWMAGAGRALALAELNNKLGTDGLRIGRALRKLGKTASSIGKVIRTVGDAVKAAGKNLADVVAKVANWSSEKIKDLVKGILAAGKSVASILTEASKKGPSTLKKFIKGLLEAGKRVGEIIQWAASQAGQTFTNTISELIRLGRKIAEILAEAAAKSFSTLNKTVKTLLELGKRIKDILAEAVKRGATVLKDTVRALLSGGKKIHQILADAFKAGMNLLKDTVNALIKAGRTIGDILRNALKEGINLMKNTVDALLRMGKSMLTILKQAVKKGVATVKQTVRALLSLGKSVAQLVLESVKTRSELAKKVIKALVSLGKKVAEILGAVARKGLSFIYTTINALKEAGVKLKNVLVEVAKRRGRILKEMIFGLYRAFRKVGKILAEFAERTTSIIRTVLEGLFLAGVSLKNAIVGIMKGVAEEFRKGFIKGLMALGKAPVDIFVEALKAGAAIAGLAVSALIEAFGGHRPLNREELKQAKRLFGSSIDLARVKIAVSSMPADLVNRINGERPFVTMYVINFASWAQINMKTLMHELAHVWQARTIGPIYIVEALGAQIVHGDDAYTVTDDALRNNNNDLEKFNPEQQAVIAEEYWYEKWGQADYGYINNRSLDVNLLRPYARQMYTALAKRRAFSSALPIFKDRLKHIKPVHRVMLG